MKLKGKKSRKELAKEVAKEIPSIRCVRRITDPRILGELIDQLDGRKREDDEA